MGVVRSLDLSFPFDAVESTFRLLSAQPGAVCVDTTGIEGLPDGRVPVAELRSRLLHPACSYATRDAALNVVLGLARDVGGTWQVVLAGLLLPGLRRAVWPLAKVTPGREADLQSEALAGLLAAVAASEVGRARVASRLSWAARRAADRWVRGELAEQARPGLDGAVEKDAPPAGGHPDEALFRAVKAGVVSVEDADLIGATRLGEMTLAEAAGVMGVPTKTVGRRRQRAEARLGVWLREQARDGSDSAGELVAGSRRFVAGPGAEAGSAGVGRPRLGRSHRRSEERQPTSSLSGGE